MTRSQSSRTALPRVLHRARGVWIALKTSLWFIPGIMVASALLLAVMLVEASATLDDDALARMPRLFGAGATGSRDMLSTIAGSVITVAGVTFSITIATLALASAQYTPRVLRTFMADRANQVVLGTFVGIYAYCLVVLRTIRGGDGDSFVPSVAVLFGFVLALVSVIVLVFFIHHIASALQPSTILERVRHATEEAIAELFPDEMGDAVDEHAETTSASERMRDATWTAVDATRTGYLQSVDADGLLAFAREHDVIIRMDRAIGDFVPAGLPLVSIVPSVATAEGNGGGSVDLPAEAGNALRLLFTINGYRTVEQDAAFGFLQISDIALKALSPGINDTTTAVTCVDHLVALLTQVARRRIGPPARGEDGELLVIVMRPTFADLVELAFDDIRRNAEGNVTVLGRLLDAVEMTAQCTRNPSRRLVLADQVDLLAEAAERSVDAPRDKALLAERASAVRALLAAPGRRPAETFAS